MNGDAGTGGEASRGVVGMSPIAALYEPRPDRNVALRAQIVALAPRHRRYEVGMIYLKLRQAAR